MKNGDSYNGDSYTYHNKDKICECPWCVARRKAMGKQVEILKQIHDDIVFNNLTKEREYGHE